MKPLFAPLFIFLCMTGTPAFGAEDKLSPNDFHYCVDVAGGIKSDSLYQVHLSDAIVDKCAAGFEDVRLFGPTQSETPYVIIDNVQPAEEVETFPLEITGYSGDSASAVVTMRLPEKYRPISVLELDIPDRDFKKHAVLSGSSDGKAWRAAAEDAIYDFSSQVDLRKTRIEFNRAAYRYYRLKLIDDKTKGNGRTSIRLKYQGLDFSVSGVVKKEIRISGVRGLTAARRDRMPVYDKKVFTGLSPKQDRDGNTVIIIASGLPVDRVYFDVSNPYYYRGVGVYSSDSGKEDSYALASRGSIYRFSLSGQHETRDYVEFGAGKQRYYKIVIENKNNPPLAVAGITFAWIQKNLYFVALSDAGQYALCFGNAALSRPEYDLPHFININNLSHHSYEKLMTAQARENTGYRAKTPREARARIEKIILTAVVILLVMGMGYWLYALIKKISHEKGAQ